MKLGDAFAQLPNLRLAQVFVQFGLTEQHDLQQLVLLGLEVGKQPDLFQGRDRHALRLFHEHHHRRRDCGLRCDVAELQRGHCGRV